MATLNHMLKQALCLVLLIFFVQDVAAKPAKRKNNRSRKKARSTTTQKGGIQRDFDTIREFQSYEPSTDKWSKIEDFESVDLLKEGADQPETRYPYRAFWAYDAVTGRWYKVDIRNYGYKQKKQADRAEKKRTAKANKDEAKPPKATSGFLKNLALGLRGGGGGVWAQTTWKGFEAVQLEDRALLTRAKEKEQYVITFPLQRVIPANAEALKGIVSTEKKPLENVESYGWSTPVTVFTHYTFFNRVRLGAGGKAEVRNGFLKQLGSALKFSDNSADLDQWINNPAWFGLFGFNLVRRPHYSIAWDFRGGQLYVIKSLQKIYEDYQNGEELEHIEKGWLLGTDFTYEHKLSDYWKFLVQIGVDWAMIDKTPSEATLKKSDLKAFGKDEWFAGNRVVVHIDLGLQLNLGKDTATPSMRKAKPRNRSARSRSARRARTQRR